MPVAELLDIYDDNLTWLGTKPRDAVHSDGDWHKAFHCWIIGERAGKSFVLFQLRGPDKRIFPNKLDITAAGHLIHGETIDDGLRELQEELGVQVEFTRLIPLGTRTEVVQLDGVVNREFDETFFLRDDRLMSEYRLQADEVSGLVEISVSDGLRLFGGETEVIEAPAVRVTPEGQQEMVWRVRAEDVIPRLDRYYLKVFIMAERYFAGSPYLAI
jgi:isopentenyldiphosphate isomerase